MAKKGRRISWVASVGCEGGPVMLADLPDYMKWTGATSFTDLRQLDAKFVESTKDRVATLHYWGQFTDRLPAPFASDEGGHQYIACATEAEARGKLAELVKAVKAALPTVEISEDEEQTHFLLPGGGDDEDDAEMRAELAPTSEYDASWQANEDEESWIYTFAKTARALFWEISGGGVAEVGINAERTEIVLMRSWVDEDEHEELARALVDAPGAAEVKSGEITIPSGKAVVIWSPIAPFDLEGINGPDDLEKLADGKTPPELDTETMGGVGTILRVKPGRWLITTASTDEDEDDDEDDEDDDEPSWSCRWCRLTWVAEA